jgi:hypothetical protein
VPGSFGLGDFQYSHNVANTKLTLVEEKPEHLKPCLIGEDFKKPSRFSQFNLLYSYIRFIECIQVLFNGLPQAQLAQYLMFSQIAQGNGDVGILFRDMLNLSLDGYIKRKTVSSIMCARSLGNTSPKAEEV